MMEKIKDSLAALIAVAVFAWIAGNVQGTSQLAELSHKMDQMIEKQAAWERTANGRREFMNDAGQRVEWLCDQNKNCRANFERMKVPE